MRSFFQFLLGFLFAVFFLFLAVDAGKTKTEMVESYDDGTLQEGDVLSFPEMRAMTLEAQNEEAFTFIAEDQVFEGEEYAGGYTKTVKFTSSEMRLVEGDASVRLFAQDGKSFQYVYDPGKDTVVTAFWGCFILWVFATVVSSLLIAIVADD